MAEGLEVTIQYRGAKYIQVAAPATPSSGFAILKRDLAHLRVHSPSQKNVRRVNGSFVLHWPNAGTSLKVVGPADSLHTRWFKLCSDDPEALKLRDFLSIESITLKQDGLLIRSTAGADLPSQDAPSGTLADRLARPLPSTASDPAPSRPPPPIPPPRLPPSAPRLDRQPPPHLKRRMSSGEGPSNQTRQKLDVPETPSPLPPHDTPPHLTQPITSPAVDQPPSSSTPGDATKASPQPTPEDTTSPTHVQIPTAHKIPETSTTPPLPREPGEMTPRPVPSGPSSTGPGPSSGLGPGLGPGPGPGPGPRHTPHHPTLSSTGPSPGSPFAGSNSSGNSHGGGGDSWGRRRDRDRDVNRLTRELWDTRRQLTAVQAREQAILDDLERLGVRPENGGGGADRHGAGSRDALSRVEADLRAERTRRLRAERALSDVERECASPFVVPALFQAFMSISELSN